MDRLDEVWEGEEQLCVAMDVGTTNSATSIVHLFPGQTPKVRVVTRWPSSPNSSKIPSLLLYDRDGTFVAAGAEAREDRFADDVSQGILIPAQWFKLHLHPSIMVPPPYVPPELDEVRHNIDSGDSSAHFEIPPLPQHVTVQMCYRDLMRYLFHNTIAWWKETTTDAEQIWQKIGHKVVIVLSHPNAWSLSEQAVLRSAVVDAGLIRGVEKDQRLKMVTEAEASVYFALTYAGTKDDRNWLKPGISFAVCDAGGSTVDTCVYSVKSAYPRLVLHEAHMSGCVQAGAIFINRAAEALIADKLRDSQFGTNEFVSTMVDLFDAKTKMTFDSDTKEDKYFIKFGYERDNDVEVGIQRGRLTLTGEEVVTAFAPSVNRIIANVEEQLRDTNVSHILLVGGFGESPYLRRRVRQAFETHGRKVITADEPSKKAVAEGAGMFFWKNMVRGRATRFEFGLATNRPFQPNSCGNRPIIVFAPGGKKFCSGGWTSIIKKGTVLEEEKEHREHFWVHKKPNDSLRFTSSILKYDGIDALHDHHGWCTNAQGRLLPGFSQACTIEGDLSDLARATPILRAPDNTKYRELDFAIGVFFGGTSLKACIIWKENGVERRGPATVMPAAVL